MKGYLLVEAGGTRYGLRLADVRQVLDLETVYPAPGSHPAMLGVIRVGGRFCPLVHLAALIERGRGADEKLETGVVARCGEQLVVLAVDDADTVVREEPEPVPDGWELHWAGGVAHREGGLVPVLDMDVLAERLVSVSADEQR
jgi:purine-binding chemotaxis protein CheW